MAKQYKWRAYTRFDIPPDPNYHMTHGVTPPDQQSWQTEDIGTQHGSRQWSYWYHDANPPGGVIPPEGYTDNNASRVVISITQEWNTQVDSNNNLIVTIGTVIDSIVRNDISGQISNTPGRYINLYKQEGGQAILSLTDLQVATNHTIYQGPLDLGTETFTIAPGHDYQRSSLYLHNQSIGSSSYDDLWVGVQFMNPLPKDYRPGASLKGDNEYGAIVNGIWRSHNRTNGACHVLSNVENVTWQECRTVNGDSGGQGNPPLILTADDANSWYNQKKIGLE